MKNYILILLISFCTASHACSCIGKSKIKNEIKKSAVIFSGKVISTNTFSVKMDSLTDLSVTKVEYYISITKLLKGKIDSQTIRIVTGNGNGDCGFRFEVGKSYIIYSTYDDEYISGDKVDKYLSTNICTRTTIFNVEEFNKIKKYVKRKG